MVSYRYTFSFLLLSLLLAADALTVHAQSREELPQDESQEAADVEVLRRYSVEVIVFEYQSAIAAGNEIFEPDPPPEPAEADPFSTGGISGVAADPDQPAGDTTDDSAVVEYGDFIEPQSPVHDSDLDDELEEIPTLASIEFRRLQPDELTMTPIYEKLQLLDAYRPILWGGWSQVAIGQDSTLPIRLRLLDITPQALDGELTLYLKNYLHLVVDLTMQQHIATIEPNYRMERRSNRDNRTRQDFGDIYSPAQTVLFQISEDRIFRSGELRYFDHPKFGALVRVNRLEDPDMEPGDELLDEPEMLSR